MNPMEETQQMNRNIATDDVRWNPYKKQYVKKQQKTRNQATHIQTTLPLPAMHADGHRWIGTISPTHQTKPIQEYCYITVTACQSIYMMLI